MGRKSKFAKSQKRTWKYSNWDDEDPCDSDFSLPKHKIAKREPVWDENITDPINNLPDVISKLLLNEKIPEAVRQELLSFDPTASTEKQYEKKKADIRKLVDVPEYFDKKFAINFDGLSFASAKMTVDSKTTTRSMTRSIQKKCGLKQECVLWQGVASRGLMSKAMLEQKNQREAGYVESAVDFQKQIIWKSELLDEVQAEKKRNEEVQNFDMPRTRGQQKKEKEAYEKKLKMFEERRKAGKPIHDPNFMTPTVRHDFDALDANKINAKHLQNVAGGVLDYVVENWKKQPLPKFDLDCLDGVDDLDVHR